MAPRDLLADLTDAQREAVTHFEGPLLILAGAGSGKTRVITRRVAYLLQQGVRPGNILAITFTNKAAGEMRQRVEALVPGNRVWISTFHSFGARLLRQYADRLGLDRNFTIYDQTDRSASSRWPWRTPASTTTASRPTRIGAAISKAKNQLLGPERYAERRRRFLRPDRRPRLSDLREAAARRQRPGLRRPALLAGPGPASTTPSCAPSSTPASASSSSTNTRTPTRPSTPSPAACRSTTRTCAWSATRTSRSTNFAAPTSAISSISSATSPTPAC